MHYLQDFCCHSCNVARNSDKVSSSIPSVSALLTARCRPWIGGQCMVTSMLLLSVSFGRFPTKLWQNFNKTWTKLWQNPVDENPKLSKTPLGGRAAAPKGYFAKFWFSSTGFCQKCVEVLSKFCRSFVEKTRTKVTSRLPCIGHLRQWIALAMAVAMATAMAMAMASPWQWQWPWSWLWP